MTGLLILPCNCTTFIASVETSEYADTDLTAETDYFYKVTAVDTSMNENPASSEMITPIIP